eukprot:scaffold7382_cov406-Prasinococcus_capsulatus_cf.AAC.20
MHDVHELGIPRVIGSFSQAGTAAGFSGDTPTTRPLGTFTTTWKAIGSPWCVLFSPLPVSSALVSPTLRRRSRHTLSTVCRGI